MSVTIEVRSSAPRPRGEFKSRESTPFLARSARTGGHYRHLQTNFLPIPDDALLVILRLLDAPSLNVVARLSRNGRLMHREPGAWFGAAIHRFPQLSIHSTNDAFDWRSAFADLVRRGTMLEVSPSHGLLSRQTRDWPYRQTTDTLDRQAIGAGFIPIDVSQMSRLVRSGAYISWGMDDGNVHARSVVGDGLPFQATTHLGRVDFLQIMGDRLVSACRTNSSICVTNLATRTVMHIINTHHPVGQKCQILLSDGAIIASTALSGLKAWILEDGTELAESLPVPDAGEMQGLVRYQDHIIASRAARAAGGNGEIEVFDRQTLVSQQRAPIHFQAIRQLEVHKNRIFITDGTSRISVYNLATCILAYTIEDPAGGSHMAFDLLGGSNSHSCTTRGCLGPKHTLLEYKITG